MTGARAAGWLVLAGCASLGLSGGPLTTPRDRAALATAERAETRLSAGNDAPPPARLEILYGAEPPPCGAQPRDGCAPAWATSVNPTESELSEAATRFARARRQRAGSPALVAAESAACAGVAPADRDTSPLVRRRDLARVEDVGGGVAVLFRAVPGLTLASLRAIVACHLARNAALERDLDPECPLAVAGATAGVRSNPDGLVVAVTAPEPEAAREVARRARALAAR